MTLRQKDLCWRSQTLLTILLPVVAGTAGCGMPGRHTAEALAQRSTETTKAMSAYYVDLAADYDRQIVTIPIFNAAPPTDAQRRAFAETQEALAARERLADGLATLAKGASQTLGFSPADAQAATKDLITRIEDVDHHSLPASVPLPGGFAVDPQAQLDRAVAFLVKAQALREYRKILPPIRGAVAALDGFFEAERPSYLVVSARRLEKDEQLTERVIATDLSVDLTPLQPSLDTFGLKLLPSAIGPERLPGNGPADTARNELKAGLSVGLTEQLHSLVAARAARSRALSQSLLGLTLDLYRATGKALPAPAIEPAELADAPGFVRLVVARRSGSIDTTATNPKLRDRVLRSLAASLSEGGLKTDGELAERLAERLNELVFGASLVGLTNELDRVESSPPSGPNLDPEVKAIVRPYYIPTDYSNGHGAAFRLFSPPAGPALAAMNRALLLATFPEFLQEVSHAR